MRSLVRNYTPWDKCYIKETDTWVWVKREDLCSPKPGPQFSKIRGVEKHLENLIKERGPVPIGVLDTVHSKAGWGVAWLCKAMGLECYDFFPVYKDEHGLAGTKLRENQIAAMDFGAHLIPLEAGRSAILYHRARKLLQTYAGDGYMMPNALKLPESVTATDAEVVGYTPKVLYENGGTWVISASSGTIAAGVLRGLTELTGGFLYNICLVVHLGYSRPHQAVLDYLYKASGVATKADIVIVDEGYEYKDAVDFPCPFPCNPYYDLKAWKWLYSHAQNLETPVVFWNVGA